MTDTRQPTSVEEAAGDLRAARQRLQELMERIVEGGGTEADLEAAERRVRFCEIRLEGARCHEHRQAKKERLEALEDLAQRTRGRVDAAGVEKARKDAEKALDRFVAACMKHNEAIDEATGELLSQEALPQGYAVDMGRDGHSVVVGSRSIRRSRPMVEVRDLGLEVLGRYWRGGYVSLGDDAY